MHAIDIHLPDYGDTQSWLNDLGFRPLHGSQLTQNILPDLGPDAASLQGDHDTYESHREKKYYPFDDADLAVRDDFAYRIEVKEYAPELLRRALSRAAVDVVGTGDYRAAERKFGLSRRMLEVCLDLGFPVFVLERSPLVLRDPDLWQAIDDKAVAAVVFRIISTPDSHHYRRVCEPERQVLPPVKKRPQ